MVFMELTAGNVPAEANAARPEGSGISLSATDLLRDFSTNVETKTRELAGAGLAYLLACNLTLVHDVNLPPEANEVLRDLGTVNVNKDGNMIRMALRAAKYHTFEGCPPMWFDKNVSARIQRSENRISISDIKGVMVDPGHSLPWAGIKNAVLEKRDGKCIASVTGGRMGVSRTQRIEMPVEVFDQLDQTLKSNGF
jgi:hypothetical protein